MYSQTCFSDHLSTKTTFFVSLENGFSLIHVIKDPVYKDHFLCFPWAVAIDRFDCIRNTNNWHSLFRMLTFPSSSIPRQRRILPKPTRKSRNKSKQKRPRSRTLTMVHDNILEDLVYPSEIVGKRTHIKLDGSRNIKVHLDVGQKTQIEHKVGESSILSDTKT